MFGLDNSRFEENGFVVVVLHELLHLGRELVDAVAADGVDAHGLGERDKVRVGHGRVRVALLVEEVCERRRDAGRQP